MNTVIITDSSCDLSYDYINKSNIKVIPFPYTIDGKEYIDDFGKSLSYEDFYKIFHYANSLIIDAKL